ncbi:uncharacterized protein [Macrobrachium rosenbergii]|uniref:uncharacterized protein n=1 Tax=Macrobrachium rosenbergii TaxID=79674 RepID=UPI0034D421E1
MKSLFIACLLSVTVLGAKLDDLERQHDFPLATGREAKEASARLLEFFDAVYNDAQFPPDMPSYNEIPATVQFNCDNRIPGYYADVDHGCQVYHICREDPEHSIATFLCPNATIFHQEIFACDWWFNVDCSVSPNFYHLNEDLYKDPEEEEISNNNFARDLDSQDLGQPELSRSERSALPTDESELDISFEEEATNEDARVIGYLPPKQGYLPPRDGYLPPKKAYLPPDDKYLPPKESYLTPKKEYLPPN